MEEHSLRRENLMLVVDAFMEILITLECSIKRVSTIAMIYEFICEIGFLAYRL